MVEQRQLTVEPDRREQVAGHLGAERRRSGDRRRDASRREAGAHGPRRPRRQRPVGRGRCCRASSSTGRSSPTVIAIVIMLAGALAIRTLPIEQYPTIAPPSVAISANYPGASAATVETTVTQVIEQQLTGLDHLLYFSSSSAARTAASQIQVTFAPGTNPDIAQVQVQNKLQSALPLLPAQVPQQGISVTKAQGDFLMVVGALRHQRALHLDRHRRLPAQLHRRPAGAGQRRRRHPGVRRPVRDAHLARSLQAADLRPDADRRAQRDAGAERPGDRRRDRRPALAARAGAQRHGHRPVAADQPRAVQGDHPEDAAERLDRAAVATWRASSSAPTTTRPPRASTASRPPASPSSSRRAPTR